MMNKHGYFFDLDGTLVNTHASNLAAYQQAIYDITGISLDQERLYLLDREIRAGRNYCDFIPKVLGKMDTETLMRISTQKAKIYPHFIDLSTLNHELIDRIVTWKQDPYALIVLVTSAKQRNAEAVLVHHGIQDLFDIKIFGDKIVRSKPDPEIYFDALKRSAIDPHEAIAFEDSPSGITAAKAAGIEVEIITWAHDDK